MELKKKKLFHNKTTAVIAFNLAFILIGIGGLATGTMAWFASQTTFKTDVGSFSVAIAANHNLKEIRFYSATAANIEVGYTFSTTPMQTITVDVGAPSQDKWKYAEGETSAVPYSEAVPVTMNPQIVDPREGGAQLIDDPFSPISPYHPILMVIEYEQSITSTIDNPFYVKLETASNFLTPSRSSGEQPIDDLPAYYSEIHSDSDFPLSSLVRTYSAGYSSASQVPFQYALTDAQEAPNKPKVDSLEHGAFATLATNASPIFNKKPLIFNAVENQSVKCVAVVLEYYVEVIEYIYSYYVGEEALEYNHNAFCDWRLFV